MTPTPTLSRKRGRESSAAVADNPPPPAGEGRVGASSPHRTRSPSAIAPSGRPAASTTGSRSARRAVIAASASRKRGVGRASARRRPSRRDAAARRPCAAPAASDRSPSPPTNSATKALAGRSMRSSGVPHCASRPRSSTAITLASRSASSMSCVTKTMVLPVRALDAQHLVLQCGAGDRVDRRERLVHQQQIGVGGQRPRHADALLLAAGKLMRVFCRDRSRGRGAAGAAIRSTRSRIRGSRPAQQARHGRDIVLDPPMRKQADRLDRIADAPAQRLWRQLRAHPRRRPGSCRNRTARAG